MGRLQFQRGQAASSQFYCELPPHFPSCDPSNGSGHRLTFYHSTSISKTQMELVCKKIAGPSGFQVAGNQLS
jgi:hypothetical protein